MAGYSGTPLVKKLGIKPGAAVALIAAPAGFVRLLVGLPENVKLSTRAAGRPDLVVWFVTARRDLDARIAAIGRLMTSGLWIAWPKKASGMDCDLTEGLVRAAGLGHGLVDYKVCAIDETWSGLKFATRKSTQTRASRSAKG
jgi:hypothetical protein